MNEHSAGTQSLRAYRASHAQLRMWFAHRLEPHSPYYNSSLLLRLSGQLDAVALEWSLRKVIERHDTLRANFVEQDGEVSQLVSDEVRLPFAREVAAGPLDGALARGALLEQLLRSAEAPFDLQRDPLVRILLLQFAPNDHLLAITMHHIVIDGWSMGPLLSELSTYYAAYRAERAAQLPALEIQYGDFAEWQRDHDDAAALRRWCDRLSGPLPALDLPIEFPRQAAPSTAAGGRVVYLSAENTAAVRALARSCGVTSYVALLAGFSAFLGHLADQSEILVGTPAACRAMTQVQPLIGYFVNTLPMRIDLSGDATLTDLVGRCKRVVAEAFADEDVALDRIVEAVRPPRRPGRSPLFDVLFTVQSTSAQMLDIAGIDATNVDLDRWWTRYDLEVNVWDDGPQMRAMFVFRDELFTLDGIDQLIAQFERYLSEMLTHPQSPVNALSARDADDCPTATELEVLLIRRLPVRECRVDLAPGGAQVDVIAVPEGALDEQQVTTLLESCLPFGVRVRSVTLLAAPMPRNEDGAIDRVALGRAAAVRRDTLQRWEDMVRDDPLVSDTRVRIVDDERPIRHVAAGPLNHERSGEVAASLPSVPEPGTALAIADGGPAPGSLFCDVAAAIDAAATGNRGITFIDASGTARRVSYRELRDDALRVAAGLQAREDQPGSPVLLQLDTDHDTVVGLWAAILAGALPVPLSRQEAGNQSAVAVAAQVLSTDCTVLDSTLLARLRRTPSSGWRRRRVVEDSAALLLLTSGSTGTPKVVPIRHNSILARSTAALEIAELVSGAVTLNWMPLDHVGGVVMSHLRDVVGDCEQVQVDTKFVLADPLRWMELAAEYHVNASWAPNFAYGLVADRAGELPPLDLSALRYLLNGGEAIVPATARAFLGALRQHGLPADALRPAWGMSETCSGQTDSREFTAESTSDEDPYVSVGRPYPGFRIRVVDELGDVRHEGEEGALEVSGVGVTHGYLGGVDPSAFTPDGWFRTGDLAVIRNGELTITARMKDVIVINGQNRPCHELEMAAESVRGVSRSFVAASAVRVPGEAADRVAVFYHHPEGAEAAPDIRRAVAATSGVRPDVLVPLERGEFPKTSIGKIQRAHLRAQFESGAFDDQLRAVATVLGGSGTVPDLFHRPIWRRLESASVQCAPWLLVTTPLVERIAAALKTADVPYTTVTRLECLADGPIVVELIDLVQAQSLVATVSEFAGPVEVVVLLRGCWIDGPQDDAIDWERAAIAAYLRSASQELPGVRIRVLELPHAPGPADVATASVEVCAVRGEPEISVRGTHLAARRLIDAEAGSRRAASTPLRVGGRYLVTGGTGGIGRLLVTWLVTKYQAQVTVIARHAPSFGFPNGVRVVRADVSDRHQMADVLEGWYGDAVLHLAGAFAQAPAAGPQPDEVFAAKLTGAQILDELLADRPDTTLVLFSSVNGFFGASGAASYAAANGALDALAAARAAAGRSVRSIGWSAWNEVGASANYVGAALRARRGFFAYDPQAALDALEVALRLPDPVVMLGLDASASWTGSRIEGDCRSRRRLVADVAATGPLDEPPSIDGIARAWIGVPTLGGADETEPSSQVQKVVMEAWCEALDVPEVRIADGFFDQGGASLQMARLHGILERRLEREIPMVELFRHTTVRAMAAFLSADGADGANTSADAVSMGRQRAQLRRERRGRR